MATDVFPPFDTSHFGAQLVWLAITFGGLYFLMSRVALPRVERILENRQSTISGDLDKASAMQRQAEEAGKAYEKTLADAKAKAQALIQENAVALAAEADAKRKAVEADLNAKLNAAEAQISQMKSRAMANVDAIAADAATSIVKQLTGTTPDAGAIASAVAAAKA